MQATQKKRFFFCVCVSGFWVIDVGGGGGFSSSLRFPRFKSAFNNLLLLLDLREREKGCGVKIKYETFTFDHMAWLSSNSVYVNRNKSG